MIYGIKKFVSTLFGLLVLSSCIQGQGQSLVSKNDLEKGIVLQNFTFFLDISGDMPYKDVRDQIFTECPPGDTLNIPAWQTAWFKYELINTDTTPIAGILGFQDELDWICIGYDSSGIFVEQKAGCRVNCNEQALPNLGGCARLYLGSLENRVYYIGLKTHDGFSIIQPFTRLITYQNAVKERSERTNWMFRHLLSRTAFVQLLLFLILLVSASWFFTRKTLVLWFLIHLIGVLGYFSMNQSIVTEYRHFFCPWRAMTIPVQVVSVYWVFISYLGFSCEILDLELESEKVKKRLLKAMQFIFIMLAIQIAILISKPLHTAFLFSSYARLIYLPLALTLSLYYLVALRSKVRWFIVTGAIAILLPAIFTLFHQNVTGYYYYVIPNVLRIFKTSNWEIPMYTTQVGILIESLCFIVAIVIKSKEQEQRLKKILGGFLDYKERPNSHKPTERKEHGNTNDLNDEKNSFEFLKLVNETIEKHISDSNFGVDQLAELLKIHRSHLHRKIREATGGMTPSMLIVDARLKLACHLLWTTDKSIGWVASECGYAESSYFSKAFKKMITKTPSEFRGQKQ